jgi:hypothetical protein
MSALRMGAGVLVWALHFTVVYGFTALACARGFAAAAPWGVGIATVVAALAAAALLVTNLRTEFIRWMTAGIAAFALVAILWEGVSALFVTPCA